MQQTARPSYQHRNDFFCSARFLLFALLRVSSDISVQYIFLKMYTNIGFIIRNNDYTHKYATKLFYVVGIVLNFFFIGLALANDLFYDIT